MKKVITFGVFDYFHLGHLRLFQNAKALGDYLIVAVQDDAYISKYKSNVSTLYTTAERIELVSSLRVVDEVVVYRDVDTDIRKFDFDVFAVGEDQTHSGFRAAVRFCEDNGKSVARMQRTRGISSSEIKWNICSTGGGGGSIQ